MRPWIRHRVAGVMALMLACGAAPSAFADEVIPPSPIVKTALLVDAGSVKTGAPLWVGVQFTIPPNWHIYWQNPGDSGIPTTLSWTLPEGLTAGDIVWPAPSRLEMSGIVNYGYSDQVVLPVPLTAARDGVRGTITVKASWLVCHETCIPESATLTAPLAANADATAQLAQARGLAPEPLAASDAGYRVTADRVTLSLTLPAAVKEVKDAHFFPVEDGLIHNSAAQQFSFDAAQHKLGMTLQRASADLVAPWHGALEITDAAGRLSAYDISAVQLSVTADAAATASVTSTTGGEQPSSPVDAVSWITALVLAFLGGLILNVMPCVLPILALKALAIARKAQASRGAAARQGIAYTVGVVVSFLLIAGGMLALKVSGAAIGWGFQLQHSGFVAALAVVMLAVAANLLGLFNLPVLFGRHAHAINESSLFGSVMTGVLAVLVATPCSAPFMATAIGATLSLPMLQALLVFAILGFGMASPFLLISLWPAALRLIPKPGAWMHRFKQLLALPMLATAAWLIWVFMQLHGTPTASAGRVMYSPGALEQLRHDGTPVLVDATAAWCLSCKVNERVALHPTAMQAFLREHHVTLMVADWTASDPAITAYLAGFGRNGVPLYVYYPPHGAPVVLPQILTPSVVRNIIINQHE